MDISAALGTCEASKAMMRTELMQQFWNYYLLLEQSSSFEQGVWLYSRKD